MIRKSFLKSFESNEGSLSLNPLDKTHCKDSFLMEGKMFIFLNLCGNVSSNSYRSIQRYHRAYNLTELYAISTPMISSQFTHTSTMEEMCVLHLLSYCVRDENGDFNLMKYAYQQFPL